MKALLCLIVIASLPSLVSAVHLTNSSIDHIFSVLQNISQYSWENGTKSEALLEKTYPSLSVFSPTAPLPLPADLSQDDISQILDIAHTTLSNRPATNTSVSAHGGSPLLSDGAAGDPASLGVAILLANWSTNNALWNNVGYGDAATMELNYLLYDVPRSAQGAISHRADQVQYWADFVYMVPPFLAYYGALHNNQSLLQEAYTQCSLYRGQLRQSSGLWNHIEGGTTNNGGSHDPNPCGGMLRVLATIKWSGFQSQMSSQMSDLQSWVEEILTATQQYITSDGLLRNYMTDSTSFEDASGSALMAASGIRLSTLNLTNDYINQSLTLLSAVSSKVNSSGYVTQVVNPTDFSTQGTQSPEAQSFLVMAYSAYDQWDKQGRPGFQSGEGSSSSKGSNGDPLGKSSSSGFKRFHIGTGTGTGIMASLVVGGLVLGLSVLV
ncbi:hypothetical protein BCR39DRAFT_525995 [Naematelia encephala]|uniref:Six-hairpin glycosidase-like protein n=1 Tax=Naematelia encephala TaxID=71784 RepID=A0A1Y2BAB2_9TREE|nr:hypothetical protein BCR39DRAFT_525995 [Naematelia encephala]